MKSQRILRVLACSAILCALMSSCLIGSSSRTENTGKYVSENTLSQIQPGQDKAYVIALIGEPSSRTAIDDTTEIWKWCYTQEKDSQGHVILLVSSNNHSQTQHTTFIEFQNSKVVKAWAD